MTTPVCPICLPGTVLCSHVLPPRTFLKHSPACLKPDDELCSLRGCPVLPDALVEEPPETLRSVEVLPPDSDFPKSSPSLVGIPRTAQEWRLLGFPIPFFVPDDKRFTSVVLDANGVLWMQGDWP